MKCRPGFSVENSQITTKESKPGDARQEAPQQEAPQHHLPRAEHLAARVVSLPLNPYLEEEDVVLTSAHLRSILDKPELAMDTSQHRLQPAHSDLQEREHH